jgi:hypothetical protein
MCNLQEHIERERRERQATKWGVRDDEGNIHHGISLGDAENLETTMDWQLVKWNGSDWEDVND